MPWATRVPFTTKWSKVINASKHSKIRDSHPLNSVHLEIHLE